MCPMSFTDGMPPENPFVQRDANLQHGKEAQWVLSPPCKNGADWNDSGPRRLSKQNRERDERGGD